MKEFKRENKYLVLKHSDVDKYLSRNEKIEFDIMLLGITTGRMNDSKNINHYVVVNEDEPYAKQVWQLIQRQWEKDNEV